ncbi:MAG: class I SAM-dependent methyltransferase [Candidatus Nanopelagicales bacterium]
MDAKDLTTFTDAWNAVRLPAGADATTVDASVLSLLALLASMVDAHAAVEVGSHDGTTGLALYSGMASDGVLTSVEADPERLRLAKEAFAAADIPHARTRLIAADPNEVLSRLTDGGYDLFVSGGKPADHAGFADQAARLLRPGGVAVFLDLSDAMDLARREPAQLSVRAFADAIQTDERWLTSLLPLANGVLLAVLQ